MKYFENRFKDKVMLITGASDGIGKAVALRASKEGAKLILNDIKEELGIKLTKEINEAGGEAIYINADLSIESKVKDLVDAGIKKFGRIDIAINNAGVMGNPSPVHLLDKEQMDFTMNNNLYSVFYCCKYELKHFIDKKIAGVIVNNASIAGITGLPGNPAYVASKHAVNGLTKNLALD
ncbi:MAG: SDR family NAD(P)-dependent oxidoreductase, partial [Mycoplasma sp.]